MSNLYIAEYSGAGEAHSSTVPAPKGFVKAQSVSIASGVSAVSAADFGAATVLVRLKNEDTVTCYYRLGGSSATAVTTDRALLPGETEDLWVGEDIRNGTTRIAVVKA